MGEIQLRHSHLLADVLRDENNVDTKDFGTFNFTDYFPIMDKTNEFEKGGLETNEHLKEILTQLKGKLLYIRETIK